MAMVVDVQTDKHTRTHTHTHTHIHTLSLSHTQGVNQNPYDNIVLSSQKPLTVGQSLSPPVASEKRIKVRERESVCVCV